MTRIVLLAALALGAAGCAPSVEAVMTALKADPASACVSIRSIYATIEACRAVEPGAKVGTGNITISQAPAGATTP